MKSLIWALPAILFFFCHFSEGLECYHCYSNGPSSVRDGKFVQCNDANLTQSNTWLCPHSEPKCVYQELQIESTKTNQIWRKCVNAVPDPCDPNTLPPGFKMVKCSTCSTDKCNLKYTEKEKEKENTFTFNVNANINLYIRQ